MNYGFILTKESLLCPGDNLDTICSVVKIPLLDLKFVIADKIFSFLFSLCPWTL